MNIHRPPAAATGAPVLGLLPATGGFGAATAATTNHKERQLGRGLSKPAWAHDPGRTGSRFSLTAAYGP
jgi:hypothetical protein